MRAFIITVLISSVVIAFAACQPSSNHDALNSAGRERYPIKGKVVSVDKINKKAEIDHEEIPGFMPAMTMKFPIHEDWIWEDLTPGSEIQAELVVDKNAPEPYYLEKVGIVAAVDPNNVVPINENYVQIGKPVPDFKLVNQDGKPLLFKELAGKAYAITFIYRECPLPEYCIKLSKQFSDLANIIAETDNLKDDLRLVSISFDPERDTPAKLKDYGKGYLGKDSKADFNIWQLAVADDAETRKIADFFGLQYSVDPSNKALINHSMITAVVGPDGTIKKIYKGSDFTPEQLLQEMRKAAGK